MEGLLNAIGALIEFCARLIMLVFESLWALAQSLNPTASKTERRRKLAKGLLGLAFLGVIFSVIWYLNHRSKRQVEMRMAASEMVDGKAQELHRQTDDKDRYVRAASPLPDLDPWGNALQVEYADNEMGESLTVRSVGPDGLPNSDDDLSARRQNLRAGDVAKGIARKAWQAVKSPFKRSDDKSEEKHDQE